MIRSFAGFSTLEQLTEAIVGDYNRKMAELRRSCRAVEREILRGVPYSPEQMRAAMALRNHYRYLLRQKDLVTQEILDAADLWCFEDPTYPQARTTAPSEEHIQDAESVTVKSEPVDGPVAKTEPAEEISSTPAASQP